MAVLGLSCSAALVLLIAVGVTKRPAAAHRLLARLLMRLFFSAGRTFKNGYRLYIDLAAQRRIRIVGDGTTPQGGICFVGSSTFTFWRDLSRDMQPLPCFNSAFGGSCSCDVLKHLDGLVLQHHPKVIVIYVGVNDAHFGVPILETVQIWERMLHVIHASLPESTVIFLALNRAPLHHELNLLPRIEAANRALEQLCVQACKERKRWVHFVDPWAASQTLFQSVDIYQFDMLHFNLDGYAVLTNALKPLVADHWALVQRERM